MWLIFCEKTSISCDNFGENATISYDYFGEIPIIIFCWIANIAQGLKKFPKTWKVHWSWTNEHQESTGPEQFSAGPEYRNGGNKICWTQN